MLGFNVAYAHSNIQAIVNIYGYMEMRSENNLSNDEFIPQLPPTCLIHGDEDKIVTIISAKLSPFRPRMGLQVTVDVLQYQ